jgi:putative transposase
LLEHCAHARFVWDLAVEQQKHWRPGRASAPGYMQQSRQLTEARREFAWLAAGSHTVQQQLILNSRSYRLRLGWWRLGLG